MTTLEGISAEATDRLTRRVQDLWDQASRLLDRELPACEVGTDLRGLAAGRCVVSRRLGRTRVLIRFNARTLEEPRLLDHALSEVAPHEVAHGAITVLGLHMRRRPRSHGPEWRELCLALGGSGDTTHQLPLERARRHREYEYRLADGTTVWLGAVRHRRLQSGRVTYHYRRQPIPAAGHTGRVRKKAP